MYLSTIRYFVLFLNILKVVGFNIRKYRNAENWSIEKLAERANLDPSYLGELERGRVNISLLKLEPVAKVLKVKPYQLLIEDE